MFRQSRRHFHSISTCTNRQRQSLCGRQQNSTDNIPQSCGNCFRQFMAHAQARSHGKTSWPTSYNNWDSQDWFQNPMSTAMSNKQFLSWLTVYVDDLLFLGEQSEVNRIFEAVQHKKGLVTTNRNTPMAKQSRSSAGTWQTKVITSTSHWHQTTLKQSWKEHNLQICNPFTTPGRDPWSKQPMMKSHWAKKNMHNTEGQWESYNGWPIQDQTSPTQQRSWQEIYKHQHNIAWTSWSIYYVTFEVHNTTNKQCLQQSHHKASAHSTSMCTQTLIGQVAEQQGSPQAGSQWPYWEPQYMSEAEPKQ